MQQLTFHATRIAVDDCSEDGVLVFADGILIAVLACLEASFYGSDRGRWNLEAGFGRCAGTLTSFADLAAAAAWIAQRIGSDPRAAAASARCFLAARDDAKHDGCT